MARLPMARPAIAAVVIAALIAVWFTAGKMHVRLPFASKAYIVKVQLADAEGLDEADHPMATVAGTRQGRVKSVRYVDGRAVATLELDGSVRGKVFRSAVASVRPAGIVPVLTVNVLPGDPRTGALPSGGTIPVDRTSVYTPPDKLLDVADTDTRAYLQVLIGQSDVALQGRGDDLSKALREAAPLAGSANQVAAALAERRTLVRKLVAQLATIATTLDRRRSQLATAVDAGSQVLDVTSRRSAELSATLRALPGTAAAANQAVANVRALSGPLGAALTQSRPAFRELPAALHRLDSLTPTASRMLSNLQALESSASGQLPAVRRFTSRLGGAATSGLPNIREAARTVHVLSGYGKGLAQLGDMISGAVSTSDANGVLARAMFTAVDPPRAEDLGLPASTSSARMDSLLALALQRLCTRNSLACILRVTTPGLPAVTGRAR